jgi:hypothetical protein
MGGYRGTYQSPIYDSILCYFLLLLSIQQFFCAMLQYLTSCKVNSQQSKHNQSAFLVDIQTMPLLLNFIGSTYDLNRFTLTLVKLTVFQLFPPSSFSSLARI